MCANCLSQGEVLVINGTIAVAAVHRVTRHLLVEAGVLPEPEPLATPSRTVSFLRGLDLDPVEILGADVVAAVDARAQFEPRRTYRRESLLSRRRASARPIGSQSRPSTA